MKAWKGNKDFLKLLKADSDITATMTEEELEKLFDYQYYLRYIDDIFRRLGLTETQWKDKHSSIEHIDLAPRRL
jgi:adenylosuccinate lyase